MKRTLKYILRCVMFFAVVFCVDRGLHVLLQARFDRLESAGLGEMIRADAEIVVLGSSRACHHYDPEVMEALTGMSVYNTGRDGLGVPYMRGVCDVLLQECNAGVLILEVDASSVLSRYADRQMKRACMYLAPYIDRSDVILDMILSRGYQQRLKHLSKAYRYNGLAMYLLYDLFKRNSFDEGYEPLARTYVPEVAKLPTASGREDSRAEFSEALTGMLREMIRTARERGIHVILVTSPGWGGTANYGAEDCEALSFIGDLADSEGVPYVIVTEDEHAEFKDASLFADHSHLNSRGATVFSRIIARILTERGLLAVPDEQFERARTGG